MGNPQYGESSLPRIIQIRGHDVLDEYQDKYAILRCTGCNEEYNYSWRQWKDDFASSLGSTFDYKQFLRWAKGHAAQHECFLTGRMGYLAPDFFEGVEKGVEALSEGRITPWKDPLDIDYDPPLAESEEDLLGGAFPERHEDPWGGVGYVVEPEVEDSLYAWLNGEDYWPPLDDDDDDPPNIEPDCLTCGARSWTFVDGDCPKCNPPIISDNCSVCRGTGPHDTCNPPIEDEDDDLDAWMDEELDLPPLPFACGIGDSVRFYATGPTEEPDPDIGVDDDRLGWAENRFDFLYGKPTEFKTYGTVTGHITAQHPTLQEIPRLHSFPPIEIDYAELEQRAVDAYLVALGIYTRDSAGNLRDEKGRCLTCIRSHDRIMEGRK